MGFYQDQIVPLLINWSMRQKNLAAYRARIIPAAEGRVLEIGIGSGLNLPFYSRNVVRVIGLEPSPRLLAMARQVERTGNGSVERGGRQPGTPNKKTALVNAAFDAATSNPDLSPLDFLLGVMRDASISPDWRIKAAQATLPYVHVKPEGPPATDPAATAREIESGADSGTT